MLSGLGQSQASDWAIRLLPVLQATPGTEVALPARPPTNMAALLQQCLNVTFFPRCHRLPYPAPGN